MRFPAFSIVPFGISILLFLSGCATILSRSNWPVSVRSNPEGARVVIRNKKGLEVFNNSTPAILKLRSGSGYFGKESYTVTISLEGYSSKTINLECKINGWYFGNILIGGILGMLVIDPATGAMYRLKTNDIYENMNLKSASEGTTIQNLIIEDLKEVPVSWNEHLVKLK